MGGVNLPNSPFNSARPSHVFVTFFSDEGFADGRIDNIVIMIIEATPCTWIGKKSATMRRRTIEPSSTCIYLNVARTSYEHYGIGYLALGAVRLGLRRQK